MENRSIGKIAALGLFAVLALASNQYRVYEFNRAAARYEAMSAAGDYEGARAALDRALLCSPNYAEGYFLLGRLYEEKLNRPAEAERCFAKYLELFPSALRRAEARERLDRLRAGLPARP